MTTRWKAAKAASKSMANLDETGIVIGGCRHVIAQKAVNMFRGEMYVCTYVGIKSLYISFISLTGMAIHIIYMRKCLFLVGCSGYGRTWCVNIGLRHDANLCYLHSIDMKPALSVMHSKAHSWHCQVCIYVHIRNYM